jgi:hypothetical protein
MITEEKQQRQSQIGPASSLLKLYKELPLRLPSQSQKPNQT